MHRPLGTSFPGPYVPFSFLFFPLFRRRRPSPAFAAILTHACIIPRSFPFKSPSTPSCPSPPVPSPFRGAPEKPLGSRISYLASRSLLPCSGGCGSNRLTSLFVVPPPTFSYRDYETWPFFSQNLFRMSVLLLVSMRAIYYVSFVLSSRLDSLLLLLQLGAARRLRSMQFFSSCRLSRHDYFLSSFFFSVLFCISIIVFHAMHLNIWCINLFSRSYIFAIFLFNFSYMCIYTRKYSIKYKCTSNSIAYVKSSNNLHVFGHFMQKKKIVFISYVCDALKKQSVTINE